MIKYLVSNLTLWIIVSLTEIFEAAATSFINEFIKYLEFTILIDQ